METFTLALTNSLRSNFSIISQPIDITYLFALLVCSFCSSHSWGESESKRPIDTFVPGDFCLRSKYLLDEEKTYVDDTIKNTWQIQVNENRNWYSTHLKAELDAGNPYGLYRMQQITHQLLRYAYCKKIL
jgi:hypothetical protein